MKRMIRANEATWPTPDEIEEMLSESDLTDEPFEDFWMAYLGRPENKINDELQLFVEPSVQGGSGIVEIYDESGQDRKENGYPWSSDFYEWCEREFNMAISSTSEEEYANKYREFIKEICGV